MSESNLMEFCQQWLAAWTGNQPEKLIAFYTDDVFYQDPGVTDGIRGKASLRNYFEKLLAKNPDWVWHSEVIYPVESGFVLKWRAEIPVGETTVNEKGLDLVLLQNNKIVRNEVYFDRVNWLKAMMNAR